MKEKQDLFSLLLPTYLLKYFMKEKLHISIVCKNQIESCSNK